MTRSARPRTASVQVWQGYLTNRGKRLRDGRFLVHGVRPITRALACDWPLETLLYRLGGPELSGWAREVLDTSRVPRVGLVPELMAELGDGVPELVAVAVARLGELDDFAPGTPGGPPPVVLVADRPDSPDALGALLRTADAFGVSGVVITGPGADHYDPRTVRASTGSLFAVPVFRAGSAAPVLAFRERQHRRGIPTRIVLPGATGIPVYEYEFDEAAIVVVGDDRGPWPDATHVAIPGTPETLGTAATATVALYEMARQRRQDYLPYNTP